MGCGRIRPHPVTQIFLTVRRIGFSRSNHYGITGATGLCVEGACGVTGCVGTLVGLPSGVGTVVGVVLCATTTVAQ